MTRTASTMRTSSLGPDRAVLRGFREQLRPLGVGAPLAHVGVVLGACLLGRASRLA